MMWPKVHLTWSWPWPDLHLDLWPWYDLILILCHHYAIVYMLQWIFQVNGQDGCNIDCPVIFWPLLLIFDLDTWPLTLIPIFDLVLWHVTLTWPNFHFKPLYNHYTEFLQLNFQSNFNINTITWPTDLDSRPLTLISDLRPWSLCLFLWSTFNIDLSF